METARALHVGDWDLDMVEADDRASAPLVLDDDAFSDAGTGVVLDEGPMERVLHVRAGSGEVGEIQDGDIVEVVSEMARVVARVQLGELGNLPQSLQSFAEGLLGLVTEPCCPPVGPQLGGTTSHLHENKINKLCFRRWGAWGSNPEPTD